jgi:hypothetical protein
LPATFIELGNHRSGEDKIIGQEYQMGLCIRNNKPDSAELEIDLGQSAPSHQTEVRIPVALPAYQAYLLSRLVVFVAPNLGGILKNKKYLFYSTSFSPKIRLERRN